MKTPKLIMVGMAILLFANFLVAVEPLTGNPQDFAKIKVKQLSKNINLTDSQKVKIEAKAYELGKNILNKDWGTYQAFLPQATQEYKNALDSILTSEQKAQLIQKRTDRKNAAIANFKKNQSKP